MLNIGYFKGQPTEYILKYGAGRLRREGAGLAFFFWKHSTQIVAVPTSSVDSSFVFNEVTNNFQSVTIQGQLTYRIHSPKQASSLLNFTIDPRTRAYASNDPDRLAQRIVNVVQMETRGELQKLSHVSEDGADLFEIRHDAFEGGSLFAERLRSVGIVPYGRFGKFELYFFEAVFAVREVKDTP